MPEAPIGITFLPSADAAANGPKQAGVEGQGGSDLAQAFKILSLHLPRVLGAASIAPKRLLTSPGSAGVAGSGGFSPYSAVFQALLESITGNPSGPDASLQSLFGPASASPSMAPADSSSPYTTSSAPAPKFTPADDPTQAAWDTYVPPSEPVAAPPASRAPEPHDRANRLL